MWTYSVPNPGCRWCVGFQKMSLMVNILERHTENSALWSCLRVIICFIMACSLIAAPTTQTNLQPLVWEGLRMAARQLGGYKFLKQAVEESPTPIASSCLPLNIITGPRSHISSSARGWEIIKKTSSLGTWQRSPAGLSILAVQTTVVIMYTTCFNYKEFCSLVTRYGTCFVWVSEYTVIIS
jgi:hypothetical protein